MSKTHTSPQTQHRPSSQLFRSPFSRYRSSGSARSWAERHQWGIPYLAGVFLLFGCNSNPEDHFAIGRSYVTQGQYEQAIPILKQYLQQHPDGPHSSRAGLFLGKAYMGLGDLAEAKRAFQRTVREYPDSLEAHKCRYKLALVDVFQSRPQEARKRFQQLADHPDGPLAPEAASWQRFLVQELAEEP